MRGVKGAPEEEAEEEGGVRREVAAERPPPARHSHRTGAREERELRTGGIERGSGHV
jgi:hypothetical protein